MPASMTGITRDTPLGATLVHGGAAFRVWAPAARQVFVLTGPALRAAERPGFSPSPDEAMVRLGDGTWGALVPDLEDGAPYRFWVVGSGSTIRPPCTLLASVAMAFSISVSLRTRDAVTSIPSERQAIST